jgi:P-type Cu2+ transporter
MKHQHSHTHSAKQEGLHSEMKGQGKSAHDYHTHDHHRMIADYRRRFYITLVITVPVMLLSEIFQKWLHYKIAFEGAGYVVFGLSTVVYLYGGYPFLKGFLGEIKRRKAGMMTLITVAITTAYVYSVAVVFGLAGMDFFWELCTLILVMLLGHWIEMKSVAGASRELELLVALMPAFAHKIAGDESYDVSSDSLQVGDKVLIKPGEKVPADGVVYEGESYVDESMLTGEARPKKKQRGDKVIAGSLNGKGALRIEASHASKNNYLASVVKLVADAQKAKSNTQLLADKAAMVLTYVALGAGIFTLLIWWQLLNKTFVFALERMVTVIVICCPHALGLAVPLVVAISTSLAAKKGLLIKNRSAFENARKITTIVFDKTGTLTYGNFEIIGIKPLTQGVDEKQLIIWAAALEQNSEHPIATGIIKKANELGMLIPVASNFNAITGKGVEGEVEGNHIKVVSPGYLLENEISFPDNFDATATQTAVFIIVNSKMAGFLLLADKIRPKAYDAIKDLQALGIKTILLTGDNAAVAEEVSKQLKMDGFFAGVLPHQKLEKIKDLQQRGEFVAMAGDGVNDAPALAQADVGIAIGSGSDIAAETAGIILVNSNPKDISNLVLFGRATHRKMLQNLVWATGYNVIALPLAAGILYQWDIMLSPAMGAFLMSLSTIIVAINAKLLRSKFS